jgi:hypothetical protein
MVATEDMQTHDLKCSHNYDQDKLGRQPIKESKQMHRKVETREERGLFIL